ncbi:MAG: SDR family NAD(P)-dependent oxidoreductase, partial [Brevundimonas sp.]
AAIVRAVLDAGDRVIATARNRDVLTEAFGPDSDRLLSVSLDVTDPAAAKAAVDAALAAFGRIDVLVNNAGVENGADDGGAEAARGAGDEPGFWSGGGHGKAPWLGAPLWSRTAPRT